MYFHNNSVCLHLNIKRYNQKETTHVAICHPENTKLHMYV